jgi:hypothetical protein
LERHGAAPFYACYEEAKKPPENWQISDKNLANVRPW